MVELRPREGAGADERSLGELVKQLSEQSAELARREVELAKAEMAIKAKRLGVGAGAFGGAGLIGLFALGALTAAFIMALATAVDGWLAAVIVAAVYAAIAGAMALIGKRQVEEGTPPIPEQAVESSQADLEEAKRRVQGARG
jgi:hypothetical protein